MARPKLKLAVEASLKAGLQESFRVTRNVRQRERIQAVLLASGGRHSFEEIAGVVGRARSTIQEWLNRFEEGGIEKLIERGRAPGKVSPIQAPKLQAEIQEGLKEGRWRTAGEFGRWLKERHGIKRAVKSLYYWLGKCAGALKVPRPVHIKKNARQAEAFKEHLMEKLCDLSLPPCSKLRVWVVDESRYGLHTVQRRCWALRGIKIVKPRQQKYEWGYVYAALECVEGLAEFRFAPTVNLEWSHDFLRQIAASDPQAEHVVIWDQAGFHPTANLHSIPARVHPLALPAYSPELNPVEKLWDILKDSICNRVFESLDQIEEILTATMRPFWETPKPVQRLVGKGWLHAQANTSSK